MKESSDSIAWRQGRKGRSASAIRPPGKPRGPRPRVFTSEHDAHLYQIVLDLAIWDEERDEVKTNKSGGTLLRGGWKAVATTLNARMGTTFTTAQVSQRMKSIWNWKDRRLNYVFERALDVQVHVRRTMFWKKASDWFARTVIQDGVQDGTEAGRPRRD